MDWVDMPQNYNDLYGILQLLRGSHLNKFPLKTLKLGWVAFHSVAFQLKCLNFQSNCYQYKKLLPVLSSFYNWLFATSKIDGRHPLLNSMLLIKSTIVSKNVQYSQICMPMYFYMTKLLSSLILCSIAWIMILDFRQ